MKLLYFDDYKLGVLKGDRVVDVSSVVRDIPHVGPGDLINGLIARFDQYRGRIEDAAASGQGVALSSVRVRPPLPKPTNIDAWRSTTWKTARAARRRRSTPSTNRRARSAAPATRWCCPTFPPRSSRARRSSRVVIGKRASNVKAADAMDYVFGYTNFIDGSARGLPPAGNVFFQMKSRDSFAPIGPYLVTKDEIPDHE